MANDSAHRAAWPWVPERSMEMQGSRFPANRTVGDNVIMSPRTTAWSALRPILRSATIPDGESMMSWPTASSCERSPRRGRMNRSPNPTPSQCPARFHPIAQAR